MYSRSQRALAECFGTAALVLVGPGAVIATLTLAGKATPAVTEGYLLGIAFAFGLIIMVLVYAIGKVSGCHINPAVTFGLAVTKRMPWRDVPVYWIGQFVGAVIGAFGVWGVCSARTLWRSAWARRTSPQTPPRPCSYRRRSPKLSAQVFSWPRSSASQTPARRGCWPE
jgi:glycerol uptake facilitator-like aquaporin